MLLPNPFSLFILFGAISMQLQAAPAVSNPIHNLKFVTIPAGHFVMGTADLDEALSDQPEPKAAMIKDETPAHKVVFEEPLLLSQTEITQKIWFSIMGTKPGPAPPWRAS